MLRNSIYMKHFLIREDITLDKQSFYELYLHYTMTFTNIIVGLSLFAVL